MLARGGGERACVCVRARAPSPRAAHRRSTSPARPPGQAPLGWPGPALDGPGQAMVLAAWRWSFRWLGVEFGSVLGRVRPSSTGTDRAGLFRVGRTRPRRTPPAAAGPRVSCGDCLAPHPGQTNEHRSPRTSQFQSGDDAPILPSRFSLHLTSPPPSSTPPLARNTAGNLSSPARRRRRPQTAASVVPSPTAGRCASAAAAIAAATARRTAVDDAVHALFVSPAPAGPVNIAAVPAAAVPAAAAASAASAADPFRSDWQHW